MKDNLISWLPLCGGLTVIGLLLSWFAWRRRGAAAGLRGAAWSLLPLVAALTGLAEMLWQMGTAASRWVSGFVFKPTVWAGVVVLGLAGVLYVTSGLLRRRGGSGEETGAGDSRPATEKPRKPEKAQVAQPGPAAAGDPDLAEIEEILRNRGIS